MIFSFLKKIIKPNNLTTYSGHIKKFFLIQTPTLTEIAIGAWGDSIFLYFQQKSMKLNEQNQIKYIILSKID